MCHSVGFWGSTSWTLPTADYREASMGVTSMAFLFKYFYYYYFGCGTFKLSQFFAYFAFFFFLKKYEVLRHGGL